MKEKLLALLAKLRGEGAPALYLEQRYRLGKCKVPAGEICEELDLEDPDDLLCAEDDIEDVAELDALDADDAEDADDEPETDEQVVNVVECKMRAIVPIFDVVLGVLAFFALCKLLCKGKKK